MFKLNFIFIVVDDLCQIDMLQWLVIGFWMLNYEWLVVLGIEFCCVYCVVLICELVCMVVMIGMLFFVMCSFDLNISWKDIVWFEYFWIYWLCEGDELYYMVMQGKIFYGYVVVL